MLGLYRVVKATLFLPVHHRYSLPPPVTHTLRLSSSVPPPRKMLFLVLSLPITSPAMRCFHVPALVLFCSPLQPISPPHQIPKTRAPPPSGIFGLYVLPDHTFSHPPVTLPMFLSPPGRLFPCCSACGPPSFLPFGHPPTEEPTGWVCSLTFPLCYAHSSFPVFLFFSPPAAHCSLGLSIQINPWNLPFLPTFDLALLTLSPPFSSGVYTAGPITAFLHPPFPTTFSPHFLSFSFLR